MFVLLAIVVVGINVGWKALGLPGRQESGSWYFLFFAALVSGAALGVIALLLRYFENQGLLYTTIGGILMGLLVIRSGSLWLLIGYHFGWNAIASGLFGLELSGFEEGASVFVSSLTGSEWLTGGDYGFEASLPAVVFEVLVLSVALRLVGTSRSTSTVA